MFPQQADNGMRLVKLPEVIYQAMYDATIAGGASDRSKRKCLDMLQSYIGDKFPGYAIVAFEDFSRAEATRAYAQTRYPFTWGMYIIIAQDYTLPPTEHLLDFIQSPKLIYDGSAL